MVVAGDKKGAFAFERARRAGVPIKLRRPRRHGKIFDGELAARIEAHDVGLVVGRGT